MKIIDEHIDDVFEIYFSEFYLEGQQVRLCEQIRLREQFNKLMKLEVVDMPYWFVTKLIENNYDIHG